MQIFDRKILRKHRDRVADKIADNDFIILDLLKDTIERIAISQNRFGTVLNIGSRVFDFAKLSEGKLTIDTLINGDLSGKMLCKIPGHKIQMDEEYLPFKDSSFDLVVSVLNLHLINDLPGVLIQINRILKTGGLFCASLVGEGSLKELREAFVSAELQHGNDVYFHVAPMIEAKTLSALMKRANFSDVVIDKEEVKLHYSHPKNILTDIKNIGEASCLISRSNFINRSVLDSCYQYYVDNFSVNSQIVCSCDIISLMATKSGG